MSSKILQKLSQLERPFLVAVIAGPSEKTCIKKIEELEQAVDAFEINLAQLLDIGPPTGDIFASTSRPCIVTNRRASFMRLYGYHDLPEYSEEERVKRLLKALELGASAVDFEMDIFDPSTQEYKPQFGSPEELQFVAKGSHQPTEFTKIKIAVEKQRKFSDEIKSRGAEVIISCHTQKKFRKEECVSLVTEIEARGANFAKLVGFTLDDHDFLEMISAVVALKQSSKIPYNIMNMGARAVLGRLLSSTLGSAWLYCRPESDNDFKSQPKVSEAKEFFQHFLKS